MAADLSERREHHEAPQLGAGGALECSQLNFDGGFG
jgi:hypothetical protein